MDGCWGCCEHERQTPKGSVSVSVSEVVRSGGRQRQPPGKASVCCPALRPRTISFSVLVSQNGPQRLCLRGLQ